MRKNVTYLRFYMKIRCKKCGDIIEGNKRGTFIQCSCKSIAIDETKWYTRLIGETEDYDEIKEEKKKNGKSNQKS